MTCIQCPAPAYATFHWRSSSHGAQVADFCRNCARAAWAKYHATDAFQAVSITHPGAAA